MILEQKRHGKKEVDDILLLSILSGVILALLIWVGIVVNDIQTEMEKIHTTLDIIEETVEQDGVLLDKINKQLKIICRLGQVQIECP